MDKLVIIRNDEYGKRSVSARELHAFLEVGRDFTTWIKARLKKWPFVENIDFTRVSIAPQNGGAKRGGQNKVDYQLTLEMAKHLAMIENSNRGIQVRNYFIACEEKLHNQTQIEYNPRLKDIQKTGLSENFHLVVNKQSGIIHLVLYGKQAISEEGTVLNLFFEANQTPQKTNHFAVEKFQINDNLPMKGMIKIENDDLDLKNFRTTRLYMIQIVR